MSPRKYLFAGAMISFLIGCSEKDRITELENQLTALESRLAAEKKGTDMLHDVLRTLTSRHERLLEPYGDTYLTPGSSGYGLIFADLGPLTVSLKNVQAYANGSRITLEIGNLSSAAIVGLKTKVEWGPTDKEGLPIETKVRKREINFNEILQSGSWNVVEFVVEATQPQEIGFVRFKSASHGAIRLKRPQ
jgi:Protein of unknown function (DUF3251)